MCYGQQCCVYGRNRYTVQCGRDSAYCVTVCILVLGVECVTVSNDVFMEGKDRQCSVAGLVLYCMRVCKLVFGVECVTVSNVVFMEGTDTQCSVAGLVLIV